MNVLTDSKAAPATSLRGIAPYCVAAVVVLLVLVCPAAYSQGDWSLALAWLLTFGPGALVISQARSFRDPLQSLTFVLVSTLFRFAVAAGGGLAAIWLIPAISRNVFLVWLAGLYVAALAVESYLTLSLGSWGGMLRPAASGSNPSAAAQWKEAGR
jgi:hypothetical protein